MAVERKGQNKNRSAAPKGLPAKEAVLDFIQSSPGKVGKREIARAFNIKAGDRIALKDMLTELADEGLIAASDRRFRRRGRLPSVTVIEIIGRGQDGEYFAVPASWSEEEGPPPKILVSHARSEALIAGIGEHVLARIEPAAGTIDAAHADAAYAYVAKPIRRLPRERTRNLGVFRKTASGGIIEPINKKQLKEWFVGADDAKGLAGGELVRFELTQHGRLGPLKARIMEDLGNPEGEQSISLIAIHSHGLPNEFPSGIEKDLKALPKPALAEREDLRHTPLITIDPEDARDHDDAVWAAPDSDPANRGGFIVIVAIADAGFYVRPGGAIDKEALKRGNSVYFPDRVLPMLPEKLSNDLCSLKEGEDRPCLAVRMTFDKAGSKRAHYFLRGMMRSRAKLSYEEAQAAIDGSPNRKTAPLLDPVLQPLWAAYEALRRARDARAPLELELPERKIILDGQGRAADILVPPRLAAHRLIEEFMIQANVAAAETLEAQKSPLVYRVHDAPSAEKLLAVREFLASLKLKLPQGSLQPGHFNRLLQQTKGGEFSELVNEVVLRAQAQAEYSAGNFGHFGLNLRRYAHFTSPIRRYADLLVHRALIRCLKLGPGGMSDEEEARLGRTAELISQAERRAMAAERDTVSRLIAAYLADRIGATFQGRISGVTKTGLFVRLDHTGADGFVPASTMGNDYYLYSEAEHALTGERTGETYRLGDKAEVRLAQAIPAAGALRFELLSEGRFDAKLSRKRRGGRPAGNQRRRS